MATLRMLWSALVTCVVCALLGGIFIFAGSDNLRRTWRLDEEGIVVDARVTQWAVASTTTEVYSSDTPELQYVLEVGGVAYPPNERVADEGWVGVDRHAWERSQASGTIRVRYLAADPRVNEPIDMIGEGAGSAIAQMAGGAVCCFIALLAPLGFVLFVVRGGKGG